MSDRGWDSSCATTATLGYCRGAGLGPSRVPLPYHHEIIPKKSASSLQFLCFLGFSVQDLLP
jgi:hypothetical protein